MILDSLFKFPIIMIDGDNEDRKAGRNEMLRDIPGIEDDVEVDLIEGEAECPYDDFVSVADRWLPTTKSFDKALRGKFDACFVVFGSSGNFIVPWTRDQFKDELRRFIETVDNKDVVKTVKLTGTMSDIQKIAKNVRDGSK